MNVFVWAVAHRKTKMGIQYAENQGKVLKKLKTSYMITLRYNHV
jgi:hypothetical protein